jgi:hypothetical protein
LELRGVLIKKLTGKEAFEKTDTVVPTIVTKTSNSMLSIQEETKTWRRKHLQAKI